MIGYLVISQICIIAGLCSYPAAAGAGIFECCVFVARFAGPIFMIPMKYAKYKDPEEKEVVRNALLYPV